MKAIQLESIAVSILQYTADLYFRRFFDREQNVTEISLPFLLSYITFHGLNSQQGAYTSRLLFVLVLF